MRSLIYSYNLPYVHLAIVSGCVVGEKSLKFIRFAAIQSARILKIRTALFLGHNPR